ncbi:endonuclease/exonuclease/phosphatase family protein [Nocardioides sp. YIM 152315]|uniref:endonuclease/exonuclease/phosphatase family protein n=1 Tax=Nocardioides sp. YIM 152315 TaxID=3031760 RepID=UPI0023DA3840|nr:endonuclease/exonuclease/phosphatase family protein [Nocardioides sp. YIM 152315]MDF1603656.1 alkaline phosphatase family protein [Nocardioides sp. YIM 152315]
MPVPALVPPRRRSVLAALVLTLATAVAAGSLALPAPPTAQAAAAAKKRAVVTVQPPGATSFRMASFNVLGADHTDGKHPRKGFGTSAERLPLAKQVLENNGVQVVGFQELHWEQAELWNSLAPEWGTFPGTTRSEPAAHNSISWRLDSFTLVQANVFLVPYFRGNPLPMPYVQLRNNATGQLAWFVNVHNPADTRGPAQHWRDEAVRIEGDLVNSLRAADPTSPVFLTGDMNDTSDFFCPIVRTTELEAANGGYADDKACQPPSPARIDWVTGTSDVTFSSFVEQRTPLVQRASDHPAMVATATIPPMSARAAGITNVVVVAVDGLRSNAFNSASDADRTKHLRELRAAGASTMNARLAYERSTPLPNTLSLLTGRPVVKKRDGHGVKYDEDRGKNLDQTAGQYISGVFDRVHNAGSRTAVYTSKPSATIMKRSWNKRNGGVDPVGRDNGRKKFNRFVLYRDKDKRVVKRAMQELGSRPATFSYVELSSLQRIGDKTRYGGPKYAAALGRVDKQVSGIVRTVSRNPETGGHTMVVIVGGSAGAKAGNHKPPSYTAPLVVWGPGVVAGADLYDLNPAWSNPGRSEVPYRSNPIFTGVVANLALGALGLAPLPGSTLNPTSTFNVFVDGPVVP